MYCIRTSLQFFLPHDIIPQRPSLWHSPWPPFGRGKIHLAFSFLPSVMTAPDRSPPLAGKTSSSAAERFFAVAELRHRLCTVADNTTVTLLARTNLQLLRDAVRVLYRSIDFNTWLRLYPATGLAQPSALDSVSFAFQLASNSPIDI